MISTGEEREEEERQGGEGETRWICTGEEREGGRRRRDKMDLHRRGEGGEGDTIWICTGEEEKEERLDGEKKNSVGKRTSIARVTFCSFFSMQIMNFFNQWCLKERAYEKRLLKFDFLLPLGKMKAVLSFTSVSYERSKSSRSGIAVGLQS